MLTIDGKTLRRSFDRAAGRSALHMVTAFGVDARLSVCQRAVAPGENEITNEITAARALLSTLAFDGALVTGDADHGRVETRRHRVTHSTAWLFGDRAEPGAPAMPGLATLAYVEATRSDGVPATRYYLSSARLTPERFARSLRAHWTIENSLHWVLDVTFDEDEARNRADNGPETLAILRRLALNILRAARPKLAISRKRKRAGWSDNFAISIIGQMR